MSSSCEAPLMMTSQDHPCQKNSHHNNREVHQQSSMSHSNNNNNNNRKRPRDSNHRHQPKKHARNQQHHPRHSNNKTDARIKLPILCSVCSDPEKPSPSYKCPRCRVVYCSVACCKQHKLICTGDSTSTKKEEQPKSPYWKIVPQLQHLPHNTYKRAPAAAAMDEEDLVDDDGWFVTGEMRTAVENSQWLRKELEDGGLRHIIQDIVQGTTENKIQALHLVQERFPHFSVFLDKLLVVAGVLERQEPDKDAGSLLAAAAAAAATESTGSANGNNNNMESLDEWLSRSWTVEEGGPPPLNLKAIHRKKMPVFEPVEQASSSSSSSSEDEEDD